MMSAAKIEREVVTMARRRGFTLVELVIVIAVILALVAIALPIGAAAKAAAHRARCAAHLKSVGAALLMYYGDEDRYPAAADVMPGLEDCVDAADGRSPYADNWNPHLVGRMDLAKADLAEGSGGFRDLAGFDLEPWPDAIVTFCDCHVRAVYDRKPRAVDIGPHRPGRDRRGAGAPGEPEPQIIGWKGKWPVLWATGRVTWEETEPWLMPEWSLGAEEDQESQGS